MGLRVAIDLDGTVADLSKTMLALAKKKLRRRVAPPVEARSLDDGEPPPRPSIADLKLSQSELDALWTHALKTKDFWTTLPELEDGIVTRIAQLAAERRWDVLFITTRPTAAGATTQLQSQQWLSAHGFANPSVYVVKGSRGKVAAALDLDAVVDDRPENCFDVATESRAKAVLVWRAPIEALAPGMTRDGVIVTPSISAAVDQLIELDREKRGGVVHSIKRLLRRH
ncbi:MAG: hypothetical protein ABI880_15020 [Acidobacteriota bacterium]